VGPRVGLDDIEKLKFLILQEIELQQLHHPTIIRHYIDCTVILGGLNPLLLDEKSYLWLA
jgi:hypothetical protein